MKHLITTFAVMLAGVTANAQILTTGTAQKVPGVKASQVVISPDGTFVVAADANGLNKVDVETGKVTPIVKGSLFYGITISGDGSKVIYYHPTFDSQHMRYVSLESTDIESGTTTVLVEPTRKLNTGISVAGNTVNAVVDGNAVVTVLDGNVQEQAPVASISYGHLQVTTDGTTVSIDPQGRASYLWPSLNDEATRVVYRLTGHGTYTCKPDGSDVKEAGNLMAPVWVNNTVVVGVHETSGVNQVPASAWLEAVDTTTGKTQAITSKSTLVCFPTVSADGSKIAYTTREGDIYILPVTK